MNTIDNRMESSPQDFGFPANPSLSNTQVWNRQEAFLAAYARTGKRVKAAAAAGISISAVEKWLLADKYGLKKRMEQAHQVYVESLETQMDDTITEKPVQTQLLQIFRLKAEHPEKYREEVKVITNDAPALMWKKLKELAAKSMPAIEGEVREVDGENDDGGSGVLV